MRAFISATVYLVLDAVSVGMDSLIADFAILASFYIGQYFQVAYLPFSTVIIALAKLSHFGQT